MAAASGKLSAFEPDVEKLLINTKKQNTSQMQAIYKGNLKSTFCKSLYAG
jgi:hypothetical protein